MRIDFEVYGDEQISRDLLRFSDRVTNAKPAFKRIADQVRSQVGEQFESEGEAGSGGWAPLKDSTLNRKAALGLSSKVLQATGDLLASLTGTGGGNIEKVTGTSLTFGTELSYGRWHQSGTRNMPQRKPIEFAEMDRRTFAKTLQTFLVHGRV